MARHWISIHNLINLGRVRSIAQTNGEALESSERAASITDCVRPAQRKIVALLSRILPETGFFFLSFKAKFHTDSGKPNIIKIY